MSKTITLYIPNSSERQEFHTDELTLEDGVLKFRVEKGPTPIGYSRSSVRIATTVPFIVIERA